VRVILNGGGYGVLLADFLLYLSNGQSQEQPPILRRPPRNPFGRTGDPTKRKVGRPSHKEKAARRALQEGGVA
jgi:hypothetical protein